MLASIHSKELVRALIIKENEKQNKKIVKCLESE